LTLYIIYSHFDPPLLLPHLLSRTLSLWSLIFAVDDVVFSDFEDSENQLEWVSVVSLSPTGPPSPVLSLRESSLLYRFYYSKGNAPL
jgi:hypothetical protein